MQIADKVPFFEADCERVPFLMGAAEVRVKLRSRLLRIRARDANGVIIAVESSGVSVSARELGARPGSYGIVKEHLPSGHTCFRHNPADLADERHAA